jgi:flagellar hook-associated protein 3 FlgL
MRVSSSTLHQDAVSTMMRAQAQLARTQNQVATGKRVQTPADDPAGAVHIIELQRQLAASSQYGVNSTAVQNRLDASEQGLADSTNVLQRVKELALQASNPTLDAAGREVIATEIRSRADELLQIANRQDPSGEYLYSGLSTTTQPFGRSGSGVSYFGDAGTRAVQVSATQKIEDGHSGYDVFLKVKAGNGTFTTVSNAGNTGTGTIDSGSVADPTAWVADHYTIRFTAPGAYEVLDGSGAQLTTGAYTAGSAIQFRGVRVTLDGAPATGDRFDVAAAGSEDLFSTVNRLTTLLGSSTTTATQRAQFTSAVGSVLTQLDQGLDHLQNIRAEVGSRLSAVDSASGQREDQKVQWNQALSSLQDLDYAEAISRMNQQLSGLQAAQQSYAKVAQLSLFNYL